MNQETIQERRTAARHQPPRPSIRIFFLTLADNIAKNIFANKTLMFLFFIIFIIAGSSIIWSLYYRLPEVEKSVQLLNQKAQLQNKLDQLNRQISPEEIALIEERISKAQSKIFAGFPAFSDWLKQKSDFATGLDLEMSYGLKQQKPTALDGVISVAVEIKLKVNNGASEKAYVHLLAFMRSLIDENWHLEIQGNELNSIGQGITHMNLFINVWLIDKHNMSQTKSSTGGLLEAFIQ